MKENLAGTLSLTHRPGTVHWKWNSDESSLAYFTCPGCGKGFEGNMAWLWPTGIKHEECGCIFSPVSVADEDTWDFDKLPAPPGEGA